MIDSRENLIESYGNRKMSREEEDRNFKCFFINMKMVFDRVPSTRKNKKSIFENVKKIVMSKEFSSIFKFFLSAFRNNSKAD